MAVWMDNPTIIIHLPPLIIILVNEIYILSDIKQNMIILIMGKLLIYKLSL
jgi:hypothetical protein